MSTGTSAAVTRHALSKLSRASLDLAEFLSEVSGHVRRVVPHDAFGWVTLDPDTLLMTGIVETDKPVEFLQDLIRNEICVADVNKWGELVRRPSHVASLSQLDAAAAAASHRLQLIHHPAGIGDELRAILRAVGSSWGAATLYRASGSRGFDAGERAFMADIAAEIGEGLRRSLSRPPDPGAGALAPGVVAFSAAGSMTSATAEARQMMALMPGDAMMTLSYLAISAARQDGARARVRLTDGRWLLLHGGRLLGTSEESAQVAVTLTSAPRADVTSMLLRLHGLTVREREVAELLMLGTPTDAVAARLHISPHTLHTHLKSIFGKVGARSRSELMALGSGPAVAGA